MYRNIETCRGFRLLAFALLLCVPALSLAQDVEPEKQWEGVIEIGGRAIVGDENAAKFREYRDMRPGFIVRRFEVRNEGWLGSKTYMFMQMRETAERDQRYLMGLGHHGLYRVDLRWDETPHVFTDTSQFLFTPNSLGVYTMSPAMRAALTADPSLATAFLAAVRPTDVDLGRKTASATFRFTPGEHWDFRVHYGREKQFGFRPFGTTTRSFTYMLELPEPIDYRQHVVRATGEYGNERWAVQLGFWRSFFTNEVDALIWEMPFRIGDSATAGPDRARLDLFPDNTAWNFSFAGGVDLHPTTRLAISIVPGWMQQNSRLLPFTTNTALVGVPALPAERIDASKQTLAMTYALTSRPWKPLELALKFRSYDYNNDTPSFIIPGYVSTDTTNTINNCPPPNQARCSRRNLPYSYDKKNVEAAATWEFLKQKTVKLVYEWEGFGREYRDIRSSDEHSGGAAFDAKFGKRVFFRASYRHARRTPGHYEPNEESFPFGEPLTALGQIHELRKFDEAERTRNRADVVLQADPHDTLSFTVGYTTTQDDYPKSEFGLLNNINFGYNADVSYSPVPELSLFAEYAHERYNYRQRSRQRTPTNDSDNNDWESTSRDAVNTYAVGANVSLFSRRFNVDAFYSLSAAEGKVRTWALGNPALPGFLVTTASDYPENNSRFHQVVASFKYHLPKNWSPRFEYRFERFDRDDFQIGGILPYMVTVDSNTARWLLLGADQRPFRAHVFEATLEYRF